MNTIAAIVIALNSLLVPLHISLLDTQPVVSTFFIVMHISFVIGCIIGIHKNSK